MPGRLDFLGDASIYTRDLANLRHMHANAVKTYDFNSTVDHTDFLNAAYNHSVDPIYVIFSVWIDQTLMLPAISEHSSDFQHIVHEYYRMAKDTGGHPAVMGYSIGGEMNSVTVIHDPSFWRKFHALTRAVRRGLREQDHAQKIITTTFVDDGGETFRAGDTFQADVDLWGSNVYQTDYPGSVIPKFLAGSTSGKPLLVSEYGYPYASNKGIGDTMQLHYVADLLLQQTRALQNNFERTDGVADQVIVGGFVFEYSDEWWKAGNPDVHNLGLVRNRQFPLGYLSEEYFGLHSAARAPRDANGTTLPDVLHERPTVALLKEVWGNGSLVSEGDLIPLCSNRQNDPVTTSNSVVPLIPWSLSLRDYMVFTLFGGMVLFLVIAFRTRARRMMYQELSDTR
ncbi:hypothetical protein PsorP6_011919 [Peronosclerospora sorghi]|uniref:Uncharacterized protein n=1 Tax=Peronosclerospora sorghi TaxID=230839 RepID=A0ACC0WK32_9STRA|nr:hypothetical protein PsorP6_011919 [Peronosclerospora sorghi]